MKEADLKSLPPLCVPMGDLRIAKDKEGNLQVFDDIRKKYVSLTPEEWVRQNIVNWLVTHKGYPATLVSNEVEISLNGTRKRCDTIVYGRTLEPLVILEYKAPDVEISQTNFDQIVRYNIRLKAKYLVVTNGRKAFCCVIDYNNDSYHFIPVIPDFREAVGMPTEN